MSGPNPQNFPGETATTSPQTVLTSISCTLIEGTPRILVRNGHVYTEALAQEQLSHSELLEALRREGCTSLSKVRYAMLENDGAITIGLRAERN